MAGNITFRRWGRPTLGGLLVLGVLAAWLRSNEPEPKSVNRSAAVPASTAPYSEPLHSTGRKHRAALAPAVPLEKSTAGVASEPHNEPAHPHPIDAQRLRIYRENNLNASLMGAMNVGDYLGLRALLEEYRMDYPEDAHRLHEGYRLIADCLEELTPERQEVARKYWKENRGSTVRRFIRRHCLERDVVSG